MNFFNTNVFALFCHL